jgi:hypothetical protein
LKAARPTPGFSLMFLQAPPLHPLATLPLALPASALPALQGSPWVSFWPWGLSRYPQKPGARVGFLACQNHGSGLPRPPRAGLRERLHADAPRLLHPPVEASDRPHRAEPCADRLRGAMPALEVERQMKSWPERHERRTRWFALQEAADTVREPGLSTIILKLPTQCPVG